MKPSDMIGTRRGFRTPDRPITASLRVMGLAHVIRENRNPTRYVAPSTAPQSADLNRLTRKYHAAPAKHRNPGPQKSS
jgi:hypothetical protein